MKIIASQILVAAVLVLVCASDRSGGAKIAATLTESDSGKTVAANVGEAVVVELNGNITTGYSWTTNAFNADVLKLQGGPEYVSPRRAPGFVGGGGKFTFRFESVAAGTSTVHLVYRRPWEKDTPPVQEFKATVVVK